MGAGSNFVSAEYEMEQAAHEAEFPDGEIFSAFLSRFLSRFGLMVLRLQLLMD